jgi:hypothetical protein
MELVASRLQSSLPSSELSNDFVDHLNHLYIGSCRSKRWYNVETTGSASYMTVW